MMDIFVGLDAKFSDIDNKPYTTLLYSTGPGFTHTRKGGRYNITGEDTTSPSFVQQTAVPRQWATHGGEDVPIYATGPMSHLFRGVVEQTHIAHAIAYAACMGQFRYNCSLRGVRAPQCEEKLPVRTQNEHSDTSSVSAPVQCNLIFIFVIILYAVYPHR